MKRTAAILMGLMTGLLLSVAWAEEGTIAFEPDLAVALAEARQDQRPVVLYFSSPRCVWCRRFETLTLTSDRVTGLADRFHWVKAPQAELDVLMGRFGVMAWPSVVVLNGQGEQIGRHLGYVDAETFRTFLMTTSGDLADEAGQVAAKLKNMAGGEPGSGQAPPELVETIELLARADRANREALVEALAEAGPAVWPGLCELMMDPKLAVRATAGSVLMQISGHDLPFDPFADEAVRAQQVAACREWVATRPVEPASQPADADTESNW